MVICISDFVADTHMSIICDFFLGRHGFSKPSAIFYRIRPYDQTAIHLLFLFVGSTTNKKASLIYYKLRTQAAGRRLRSLILIKSFHSRWEEIDSAQRQIYSIMNSFLYRLRQRYKIVMLLKTFCYHQSGTVGEI